MFPVEIWERILNEIDIVEVQRLRVVCRTWREIIERFKYTSTKWTEKCLYDIPEDEWNSLMKILDVKPDDSPIFWQNFYKSWIQLSDTIHREFKIEKIKACLNKTPLVREIITSLDTHNDIIAVGTDKGYISFYDVKDVKNGPLYKADNLDYVWDIKFFPTAKRLLLVSTSIHRAIKFWNVDKKKQVNLKDCKGYLLCANDDQCFIFLHNKILVVNGNRKHQVYQYDTSKIEAASISEDRLVFRSNCGDHYILSIDKDRLEIQGIANVPPPRHVRHYFAFEPNLMCCITEEGVGFSFQAKEWKIYNMLDFDVVKNDQVSVIFFHSPIMILGFVSGKIIIYKVKNVNALHAFDFDKEPHKKLKVSKTSIISVKLMQVDYVQRILVASEKHVHVIKFA